MEYMCYLFGMCWSSTGTYNLREIHLCTEKQEAHTCFEEDMNLVWLFGQNLVLELNKAIHDLNRTILFWMVGQEVSVKSCLGATKFDSWMGVFILSGLFIRMAVGAPSPFLILIICATFIMHNLGRRLCKVQGYCQPWS